MSIEDEINFKGLAFAMILPIIAGLGLYVGRSIDFGEWNLKKQNAINYEFKKFKKMEPDKKTYFDWASQALALDSTKNYYDYLSTIRGRLGKANLDNPLFIDDFKKYIEQYKNE